MLNNLAFLEKIHNYFISSRNGEIIFNMCPRAQNQNENVTISLKMISVNRNTNSIAENHIDKQTKTKICKL
jgi:hypothetical protein